MPRRRRIFPRCICIPWPAIALGAPPLLAALLLAYTSNLFTSLTQYAGCASPTLFGLNYITVGEWWRTAAIAGVVSLSIWIVVGGAWMNLIASGETTIDG
nr:anion permease [Corynebacterium pilosum]